MKLFITASANCLKKRMGRYGCEIAHDESYTFSDGEHGYRIKALS